MSPIVTLVIPEPSTEVGAGVQYQFTVNNAALEVAVHPLLSIIQRWYLAPPVAVVADVFTVNVAVSAPLYVTPVGEMLR